MQWKIQVHRNDSAFVYSVIDAQDGLMTHTTLDYEVGSPIREILVLFDESTLGDVEKILTGIEEIRKIEKNF